MTKHFLQLLLILLSPFVAFAQTTIDGMTFCPNPEDDGTCYLQSYTGDATEVVVPESVEINGKNFIVTKIGNSNPKQEPFNGNHRIVSVILPKTIESIESYSFSNCRSLKKINIPEGITEIADGTFQDTAIERMTLPSSMRKIQNSAFSYCYSLNSINIPDSVEEIGDYAFSSSGLKSINIQSSIKVLGSGCFSNSRLQNITIEKSTEPLQMGNGCFDGIYGEYMSLSINRELIVQGNNLLGNYNLNNLIIGENVTNLSWLNPTSNYNLSQIVSSASNPPSIGNFTNEQYQNIKLYLPSNLKETYENDPTWSFFQNIITLDNPVEEYNISAEPDSVTINVGESTTFDVTITPQIDLKPYMAIGDNNIVYIDYYNQPGAVYGSKPGETDVIFTLPLNNKQAVCHVTVIQPATSIILNKKELSIEKGSSATIFANVAPLDVTDPTVTWTSSDPNIATVDNGVITAVKGGECEIIAATHNGLEAKCKVNVIAYPESVTLNSTNIDAYIGDAITLTATLAPEDVTEKELTWTSSDVNVATVENGIVSCLDIGETTITVSTVNDLKAECKIIVYPILPDNVSLDQNYKEATVGETFTLTATISPENVTDKSLIWSSANEEVATVDNGTVTCLSLGETVITVTTSNGFKAECIVNVNKIPVESVTLDKTKVDAFVGDVFEIDATINPAEATDKTLSWVSSEPEVAKVENGIVTCLSPGNAIITATCVNGVSASCSVKVDPVLIESITIDPSSVEAEKGESVQLTAIILPENATYTVVEWSSSNPAVAKVDENGCLQIMNPGIATITAKATDGSGKEAYCEVTGVSGVEELFTDGKVWNLYSTSGILICKNISVEEIKLLNPDIYILSDGKQTIKIVKN